MQHSSQQRLKSAAQQRYIDRRSIDAPPDRHRLLAVDSAWSSPAAVPSTPPLPEQYSISHHAAGRCSVVVIGDGTVRVRRKSKISLYVHYKNNRRAAST